MSRLEVKTEPNFYNGQLFYGLLSINEAGLITKIDILVADKRFSLESDPQWMEQVGTSYSTFLRYRQVLKQKYHDKLAKDLT